jgi:hypothetical protein
MWREPTSAFSDAAGVKGVTLRMARPTQGRRSWLVGDGQSSRILSYVGCLPNPRLASIKRTSHQTGDRGLSLASHAASPIFKRCPEERSPIRCEARKVRGETATARRKLGHTSCEITILSTQLRLRQPALGSAFSARQAIIALFQGASSKPTPSMAQAATYRAPVPLNPKNWRAAVEPTVVNTWVNPCHLLARNRSRADANHIRKGGHT